VRRVVVAYTEVVAPVAAQASPPEAGHKVEAACRVAAAPPAGHRAAEEQRPDKLGADALRQRQRLPLLAATSTLAAQQQGRPEPSALPPEASPYRELHP
jgi:hypothetical protein